VKELFWTWVNGEMTPEQWRVIFRFCFVFFVSVHIIWSGGYFQVPGFPSGFAFAEDVQEVKGEIDEVAEEVHSLKTVLLRKDIELAQQRVCQAAVDGNSPAMRYSVELRNELTRDFREAAGRQPLIPTCEELGIGYEDDDG